MMRHPSHVTCYAFNYLFFHTIEPAHWDDEVMIADFSQYLLCEEKQIGAWSKSFNPPAAAFDLFATSRHGFFCLLFSLRPKLSNLVPDWFVAGGDGWEQIRHQIERFFLQRL